MERKNESFVFTVLMSHVLVGCFCGKKANCARMYSVVVIIPTIRSRCKINTFLNGLLGKHAASYLASRTSKC
jgi:hypothetical protein